MASLRVVVDPSRPAWTSRELLRFTDLAPGLQYSLPFFAHDEEAASAILFTDEDGNMLDFCEDQVYEAVGHRLLWVRSPRRIWGEEDADGAWNSADWEARVFVYSAILPGSHSLDVWSDPLLPVLAKPQAPEGLLVMAEYFRPQGESDGPQDRLVGWTRILRNGEDEELSWQYISVVDTPSLPVRTAVNDDDGAPFPGNEQCVRRTLSLDTGIGRVTLRRRIGDVPLGNCGRIHLRAYFFDTLRSGTAGHWIALQTPRGQVAVGLSTESPGFYAVSMGRITSDWQRSIPDGLPGRSLEWQTSGIARTAGWHLFDIVWEMGQFSFCIDTEPVCTFAALEHDSFEEVPQDLVLWLVAARGDVGYWAGLEMFHTPFGQATWAAGVQNVTLGDRSPWEQVKIEQGHWQISHDGIMRGQTGSPQTPPEHVAPPELDLQARPRATEASLAIECWSLPVAETALARIERVMGFFLEQLQAQGVALPDNVERIGQCREAQHATCYIYRFGTRRLHVATREGEAGRLCLVVRCGGGFFDFAEFAQRNGSLEQLRLQRQRRVQGRQVLQLTSVLSNRAHRITEVPRPGSRHLSTHRQSPALRRVAVA